MGFITNIVTIFTLQYIVNGVQIEDKQPLTCSPGQYQMVNPYDSHTFYNCSTGKAILFHCSEGSWYSPDSQSCIPKTEGRSRSGRSGGSNNPDNISWAQNQAPSFSNGGVVWWTQTSPKPGDFPSGANKGNAAATTTRATISDKDCTQNGPLYIKNPANCSTFFICIKGQAVLANCPIGLFYNSEMARCDISKPKDCE